MGEPDMDGPDVVTALPETLIEPPVSLPPIYADTPYAELPRGLQRRIDDAYAAMPVLPGIDVPEPE
jgi:hypothetical protein